MPLNYIQRFKPTPPVTLGVPLLMIETIGPGSIGQIHVNADPLLHPITRNVLLISGDSNPNTSSLSVVGNFDPWNWSWSLLGTNHPLGAYFSYGSCEFANSTDIFTTGGLTGGAVQTDATHTFDGISYTSHGTNPIGITSSNVATPIGSNGIFNVGSNKEVWLYNTDTHLWNMFPLTIVPTVLPLTSIAQITTLNNKQGPIVLGTSGFNNFGNNEVLIYTDGIGWTTAAPAPTNYSHSAFVTTDDNKVLLISGYDGSGTLPINALRKSYVYDIDSNSWSQSDLSIPVDNSTNVARALRLDDGRIFLYHRLSGRCYIQIIGTNAIFDGFESYPLGPFTGTGYTIIAPTSTLTVADTRGVGGARIQGTVLNSAVSGAGNNFIINNALAPSNFTAYAHCEYDTVGGTTVGIIGRYVDVNNHIKILLEPGIGTNGTLRVQEVIGGVITNHDVAVTPSFPLSTVTGKDRDYIILAQFLNNDVKVRIMRQITPGGGAQGFQALITTVSHISGGRTGFFHNGAAGTNARFDDFYVRW